MKPIIIGSAILLISVAKNAVAVCPTPSATQTIADETQIGQILEGNYACAIRGSERWNELHSGGTVIDYKLGPTHPVDPSKPVGGYTIAAGTPATITYDYGPGGSYTYCISPAGTGPGNYGFYNIATNDVLRIRVQTIPCDFP